MMVAGSGSGEPSSTTTLPVRKMGRLMVGVVLLELLLGFVVDVRPGLVVLPVGGVPPVLPAGGAVVPLLCPSPKAAVKTAAAARTINRRGDIAPSSPDKFLKNPIRAPDPHQSEAKPVCIRMNPRLTLFSNLPAL